MSSYGIVGAMLRPRTPAELWEWTYRFLGIRYPNLPVCEDRGHTSPFDFIAQAYCEQFDTACNVGPRGGGKTIGLSVLHHANSLFKPGCWTVHVGAIEAQAKRCNAYMNARFATWPWHLVHDRRNSSGRVLTYLNGSRVEILPATMNAVSGPRPPKASFDEVEWWRWDVYQQALNMITSTPEIPGQLLLASTRQKLYGTMQRIVEAGVRSMIWCVYEVMQRCPVGADPTRKGKGCPLFEAKDPQTGLGFCQMRVGGDVRFRCQHDQGHVAYRDVIRDFSNSDAEVWQTQKECMAWGQRVMTDRGELPIGKIVDERLPVKVLAFKPGQSFGWCRVTGWFNNGTYPGPWYRVTTSPRPSHWRAREVRCTPDHEFILRSGEKRRARDLRPGDPVWLLGLVPTHDQIQVLLGTLFGDGHVTPSHRLLFAQHRRRLAYVQWLATAMAPLEFKETGSGRPDHVFLRSRTEPVFAHWRARFYPRPGTKVLLPEAVSEMSSLALAVWYMDDGRTPPRDRPRHVDISLGTGTDESDERAEAIANAVSERWGLDVAISRVEHRCWRAQHVLRFRGDSFDQLRRLVSPWLRLDPGVKEWTAPPLIGVASEGALAAEITSVTPYWPARGGRGRRRDVGMYDLEVRGAHTYFAGGILVSNCQRPTRRGLVYPGWDRAAHVNATRAAYQSHRPVILGGDWGWSSPTVIGFYQREGEQLWRFDEYVAQYKLPEEILDETEGRLKLYDARVEEMWADRSQPALCAAFRKRFGIRVNVYDQLRGTETAGVWTGGISEGLAECRRRLRDARGLTWYAVHPRCAFHIAEFDAYHLHERNQLPDGTIIYDDAPADESNHSMDEWRYVCIGTRPRRYPAVTMADVVRITTTGGGPPERPRAGQTW